MCFGGGGGSSNAAPTNINFAQPVSKQIAPPQPVERTFKSLIDDNVRPGVRTAGTTRRRMAQTPLRKSLSTGLNMPSSTPYGGINL